MTKKSTETKDKEAKLRDILTPFASWIYGDLDKGKTVIDKYFKQIINK